MPVYFLREANTGRAIWCSEDGAEEIALCSVSLDAYESEAVVRDRFGELVNTVADHCRRKHVAEVVAPASCLAGLPCETCEAPEADDIRFRAGQISDASELQLSSNGYPVGCCNRRIVGAFGGRPDTPRSAVR